VLNKETVTVPTQRKILRCVLVRCVKLPSPLIKMYICHTLRRTCVKKSLELRILVVTDVIRSYTLSLFQNLSNFAKIYPSTSKIHENRLGSV